jgi:hypothetical protein
VSLFCFQFFFKRKSIVDPMTDFKGKMRTKEAVQMAELFFYRHQGAFSKYFLIDFDERYFDRWADKRKCTSEV